LKTADKGYAGLSPVASAIASFNNLPAVYDIKPHLPISAWADFGAIQLLRVLDETSATSRSCFKSSVL
jgi:hypothetical protein